MPKLRVIFSDTKKVVVSQYDDLSINMDGDTEFLKIGEVYFDAVDKIEVLSEGNHSFVIFEKSA